MRSENEFVKHCGNTYKACCLPWGWCHCICGDCRVAVYRETEDANQIRVQPRNQSATNEPAHAASEGEVG